MLVHIVDPAAYTPPYDHALAGALARAGVEVELITSRFPHGPVPAPQGYSVNERFYGRASALGLSDRRRRALRAIEHLPGMLSYRRAAESADVVHYQWLPLLRLDRLLLPPARPRVFTMHWRLPPAGTRVARALARLLAKMDAVVVHSEHGAGRLAADFGVPPERLEVIAHGALDYLTRQQEETPLPEELARVEAPVILSFGLVRPYKGTEVLLEAFQRLQGAELWVVGKPLMPMDELRELAARAPGRVRFVDRFIADSEIPAYMRRADLVVLPYLNIEQSGVLYTALAFGRPLVLSDVGGFAEVAAQGAARLVPPGDPEALADALTELLADPAERESMSAAAEAAAAGPYSWDAIGARTVALYERLLG
jgi:glycosyltransferase involved in cell wall biosynthesis